MRQTVLVIEDNTDLREAIVEALEAAGFATAPANHGKEAMDLLKAGVRPVVILLDLMMPVMNGFEFLAMRAKDPELARVPVIVLSAMPGAQPADVSVCLPK